MPRFIYDPAESHLNHALHVNGKRVQVGQPFDLDGDPADDPKLATHIARVPGRVVAGEALPCIVPVADRDEARRRASMSPGEVELRKAVDTLAESVGLAAGAAAHTVVDAIKARLEAKPLGDTITETVGAVRRAARDLDPAIPGDPKPGANTGPAVVGGAVAITADSPAAHRPVGGVELDVGEPRRQYDEADLAERSTADLDALCAQHGVATTSAQRKSKAGRIEALRRAGLVAEA